MRSIRKLFFQNSKGQQWGLNGDRGLYASNLSGFGQTLSPNFADLGRGFFSVVDDRSEPQTPLAFTLTFTRSPYETYSQLMDWLASAGTITIVYAPTGARTYCRDVTISFVQKGELNPVGWLECPCSFQSITPWYLPVPSKMELIDASHLPIKRYTYQYTPDLMYGSDGVDAVAGSIPKTGHIPAAIELSYRGSVVNPSIRLVGRITKKVHGVCAIQENFAPNDILKFSTRYRGAYVKKVYPDGTEKDLLNHVDLRLNPFFRIPVDEPCDISIESETGATGYADLLIYYYFRSV